MKSQNVRLAALCPLTAARAASALIENDQSQSRLQLTDTDSRKAAVADLAAQLAKPHGADLLFSARVLASVAEDAVALKGVRDVTLFNAIDLDRELEASQLLAVALILNEIVLNALQHAHPSGVPLLLDVWCRHEAHDTLAIDVRDDGVGLPVDGRREGFGLSFARATAAEIGGGLSVIAVPLGLTVSLRIPA